MISFFRRLFVDSWLGRVFAVLIFAAFVVWGVGDFFTSMGRDPGIVASVGARRVGVQEFDTALRQQLQQVAQQTGGDPSQIPPAERGQVAMQVLQGLVSRAEALREADRLGVVVPDDVLRQAVFDLPLFKGENGQFDRPRFDQWLASHNLSQQKLLSLFREDLATGALIAPLRVGAKAPATLVRRVYDYGAQTRSLDMVRFVSEAMPPPPAPDEAGLRRYYDNHAEQFQAPATRRIKLVLLSPATTARALEVPEADERALFAARYGSGRGAGIVPEKRSVEVITAPSEARARALALLWNGGAGWPQMQAAAADSVPVALDDATQATFPDPQLGRLAFAASPGQISGPVHLPSGWVLLRVTRVVAPATRSFEALRPALRDEIALSRAREGIADRVQKLQDAIAGGGLDAIPAQLGAAAAEGTLDAQGRTASGEPAPLPAEGALRRAILDQAFAQKPGDPPVLRQGPDESEYALAVESATPARSQPFDAVRPQVEAAMRRDARRHEAEQQAASLYAQVRVRGGLTASGRPDVVHVAALGRGAPAPPVAAQLTQLAFSLTPGSSTMLQTADGFVVVTVTGIQHPEPSANRLAYDRLQGTLDGAIGDDIEASYAMALRGKTRPVLNAQAIRSVIGQ